MRDAQRSRTLAVFIQADAQLRVPLAEGGAKFAGFEFFKLQGATLAGGREAAEQYRTAIYIGGSSAAELIATTLLTPLEAARIRLVSTRGYASGLIGAVGRMAREGGLREFYAGYAPILCKQIPYAIGQVRRHC